MDVCHTHVPVYHGVIDTREGSVLRSAESSVAAGGSPVDLHLLGPRPTPSNTMMNIAPTIGGLHTRTIVGTYHTIPYHNHTVSAFRRRGSAI